MQWNGIALLRGTGEVHYMLRVWCFLIQGLIQFPVAACAGTSGAGVSPPSVCLITSGREHRPKQSSLVACEAVLPWWSFMELKTQAYLFWWRVHTAPPFTLFQLTQLPQTRHSSAGCQWCGYKSALKRKEWNMCWRRMVWALLYLRASQHMTLYQLERHVGWRGFRANLL